MNNEEVAVKLAEHENRIKVSEHRIKDLEEQQEQILSLTVSVKELAISTKSMAEELAKQQVQIEEIKAEPVKQWTQTKKTFFTAITSAIGTAIAGGIIWLFVFVSQNM